MPIGPKLNRDWEGLRVKLTRSARNAYGTLAEGTVGVVTRYGPTGIEFYADCCEACGFSPRISGMRRDDFVIITPEEEWPDTRGRGRNYQRRI